MSRQRLVFLANSFHLGKTRSTHFLIELLERHFDVTVVPHKRAWLEISWRRFDILVAFQHLYPPRELEAFGVPKVVLVPMFDDCPKDPAFWKRYRQFSVLSFSKSLVPILEQAGVSTCAVHYFPPVSPKATTIPAHSEGIRAFFWQRTPLITWEKTVKQLFGQIRPTNLHIHSAADPGFALAVPSETEIQDYHISTTNWFENPDDMKRLLQSCNVYFAPRLYEGIGMSFLEALALGQCVVAPDRPTMNEYISHAVDGILYDPENPQALEELLIPESVAVLGAAAQDRALVARVAWEGQESAIVSFIGEEPAVWLIKRRLRGFYFRARALLLELGRRVKHWKE